MSPGFERWHRRAHVRRAAGLTSRGSDPRSERRYPRSGPSNLAG